LKLMLLLDRPMRSRMGVKSGKRVAKYIGCDYRSVRPEYESSNGELRAERFRVRHAFDMDRGEAVHEGGGGPGGVLKHSAKSWGSGFRDGNKSDD